MSRVELHAIPAVVKPTSLDRTPYRSFLADVVVEHGPRAELTRTFLLADTHLRESGVRLSFASFEELIAVNRANKASWSPLLPLFDPSLNDLDDDNGFALLGRSASGQVVVTVAARLYELGQGSLAEEIESLRVLYRDPEASALPGEAMHVTSAVARATRGRAVFSGAAWVHPDWRKKNLIDPAAPIVRGLGLTRWMPDLTFSFMVPELVRNGTAKRWHMNVDWEITMINTPVKRGGTINAALSWTKPQLMLAHFSDYVAHRTGSSQRSTPSPSPHTAGVPRGAPADAADARSARARMGGV